MFPKPIIDRFRCKSTHQSTSDPHGIGIQWRRQKQSPVRSSARAPGQVFARIDRLVRPADLGRRSAQVEKVGNPHNRRGCVATQRAWGPGPGDDGCDLVHYELIKYDATECE